MKTHLTILALGVLAVGLGVALPNEARANHGPFSYRGTLYGCHGESQLIAALQHLDRAYNEQLHGHWSHAHREADFAAEDLRAVRGMLSSRHAQADVFAAERALARYCHFRSMHDLQTAASLISHALEVEQSAFRVHHMGGPGHVHGGVGLSPYRMPHGLPTPNVARPRIVFRLGF